MSFHLSTWSIKNPIPIIVSFVILVIVGFQSFFGLGIDTNPNIDIPSVMITVTQRGAGPTELETEVTKKIEDAVAGLGNIDQIVSTVSDGVSSTTINFTLGTDIDRVTNDVRNAISQIRQNLPQDVNDPVVRRLEFAGGSVVTYAVSSEKRSVAELSDIVDRTLTRQLLTVKGVSQVVRLGGVDREIRIDLDPTQLQALNITATQINEQIRNFNINLPGGRSEIGGTEQNIRTLGSAKTVDDLRNFNINLSTGDTIPLSSIGTITDGFAEPRQTAYLNGKPVVGFAIRRSTGSTLVNVAEGVQKELENLQKTLPPDLKIQQIFTRATAIRDSYQSTLDDLLSGCLLTVLTVGLFLWEWKATIITGLALPFSIIPTFLVMQALDYTLNGMTLLALALALGNLIDDAVCMVENIDQHLQMGKTPLQASFDASREIGLAVLATAATIIAVFIPVAFMGGVPGQFFRPFGVTIAVSTVFSTLVATTLTPLLSAYILPPKKKAEKHVLNNNKFYGNLLKWALKNRITTLIIATVFFIGSLQLIPLIPKGLFSSGDNGISTVAVELPPGSKLADTENIVNQLDRLVKGNPAIENVLATVGGDNSVNTATIYIRLVPKEKREISQKDFQDQLRKKFREIPGAKISFRAQGGGGSSKDVSIILKSENPVTLAQSANQLETEMREIPGLVEVNSSLSLVKPEMVIIPNVERAKDLGISVQNIARTASLALLGDNESNLPKFNLVDRQIPIRIQLDPKYRQDIETIKNLQIPNNQGTLIPLSAVAEIQLGNGPAEIKRFNRNRQVTVDANLEGLSLGEAITKVRNLPTLKNLPPDVSQEPAGDAKIMRDIFSRFASALGLAILAIYAILVLLYNDFFYPLGILVSLPLSLGGTLLALLIAQKELGLYALIGIVLLMGLVTKNAILLVDFALMSTQSGKPPKYSALQAGLSRLRPILMTSVSTIAGMIPIALGLGADGQVRSPMAISVIGGFTTSTLFTLIVIPVVFTYIDDFSYWLKKRFYPEKKHQENQPIIPAEVVKTK